MLTKQPCIDIVLPFKNVAPWLGETLMSIQNQTHSNFRVHMVDDNSTDLGPRIAQEFADSDPRFHRYSNSGTGILAALETALPHLKAPFLHRMDGDDIMPIQKLEWLLGTLLNAPDCHFATGSVKYFSKEVISEGYLRYEAWLNGIKSAVAFERNLFIECPVSSANWLIRKEHFDEAGGFGNTYPEDYNLIFSWFQAGYRPCFTQEVTHLWREHPDRTSRNSEHYQQAAFFQLKMEWLRKLGFMDKGLLMVGTGSKMKWVKQWLAQEQEAAEILDFQPSTDEEKRKLFEQLMQTTKTVVVLFHHEPSKRKLKEAWEKQGKQELQDFLFLS